MVDDNKMMTLTYFDLMGRAEAARMVLTHGQVEFHDHRVSGESWAAFKASEKCPSGQLPVLEDEDGVCMQGVWSPASKGTRKAKKDRNTSTKP
mmetsp:Transcript_44145/g.44796  ORF Transcript_44145/g.44796 Transcript_44145/m.44796 type:complete len:93 (+) Transcript_44145:64-342(+)